jgi:glutamyl-tRNA synthetase
MIVKTRFAPSPTGMLHVGNARTALINKLFALKHSGEFILRIDDTDLVRSKKEYEEAIKQDLKWLGIDWSKIEWQSKRLSRYEEVKNHLINNGRLYECYETPEELEIKRKLQLSSGKPPIYDRSALKLSEENKEKYKSQGRKPHYRFKLEGSKIEWQDMVKGSVHFEVSNISDPIVIREDGSMTYMICSTVDDVDMEITHVIRGEDHVTNTAIQIQIFEALNSKHPEFGHLSLVKTKDDKISKRIGGFEIASLRDEKCIEAMSINSFFGSIGTSNQVVPYKTLVDLAKEFDITKFSKSPTTYVPEELDVINHKLLLSLEYEDVQDRLVEIGASEVDKDFWIGVRPNLKFLSDVKLWWDICHNYTKFKVSKVDIELLSVAKNSLIDLTISELTWKEWTEIIKSKTGRSGKQLYMPIRQALTGMDHGPELANLIPLIGKDEIIKRLELLTK